MHSAEEIQAPQAPVSFKRGYVQLYMGEGFGKSMAAFGLAVRMSTYNQRIYIARFWLAEIVRSDRIHDLVPNIEMEFFGDSEEGALPVRGVRNHRARAGMKRLEQALVSGSYGLVVGDALLDALEAEWVSEEAVKNLIRLRRKSVEFVITGTNAPDWLIDKADLVSERVTIHPKDFQERTQYIR